MLFKEKSGDVEEMALMYRNPPVQSLPAAGPWYGTQGYREAYTVPDRNALRGFPRRLRTGAVLGLSLDTQTAVTSPDKSGDQVSCPVKGKCQSFASCKHDKILTNSGYNFLQIPAAL